MMLKLVVFALITTVLSMANPSVANTPENTKVASHKLPSSTINGIEVPYEVLEYAQNKYQGHAVTQALKGFRNGQPVYQLRVDDDDNLYDDDCIYLFYDMKWKLLDDKKAFVPKQAAPVPKREEPKPENTPPVETKPAPPAEVKPQPPAPEDNEDDEEIIEEEPDIEIPRRRPWTE